jgi:hypothetical protein
MISVSRDLGLAFLSAKSIASSINADKPSLERITSLASATGDLRIDDLKEFLNCNFLITASCRLYYKLKALIVNVISLFQEEIVPL